MTWLWVLAVPAAAIAIDQAALWAERRGWLYWRERTPGGTGTGGGVFDEVFELFQPSRRHLVEEQQYQRRAIVQTESGDPEVDLDAGTATIRRDPRRAPDAP